MFGNAYQLCGQAGYINMIDELNKICSIYGQGKYADTSLFPVGNGATNGSGGRSITLEDIEYTIDEEPTTETYTKNAETGYINDDESCSTFVYWGEDAVPSEGKEWKTLKHGESVTIASYGYAEGKWTDMQESMILGCEYFFASKPFINFSASEVRMYPWARIFGEINQHYLSVYTSECGGGFPHCGIRPVVYLDPDIELSYDSETGLYTII